VDEGMSNEEMNVLVDCNKECANKQYICFPLCILNGVLVKLCKPCLRHLGSSGFNKRQLPPSMLHLPSPSCHDYPLHHRNRAIDQSLFAMHILSFRTSILNPLPTFMPLSIPPFLMIDLQALSQCFEHFISVSYTTVVNLSFLMSRIFPASEST
jgi:hypothetical protein